MDQAFLKNSKNKVVGQDEKGYYIGVLVDDIVSKKHHLTKVQFKKMINKWVL